MARAARRIGSMVERVRIERRSTLTSGADGIEWDEGGSLDWDEGDAVEFDGETVGDGYGNTVGGWSLVATRRCEIRELRGDEVVLGAKLQGRLVCYVIMRADEVTEAITEDFRLVDVATKRVLNVRHAPPPTGRDRFVSLLCESGVAEG